ncbi:hypothetical protein N473_23725 [Pseudoalteromonas luteoviolacea CPMOR-1]|uniref:Uncharacterized protein n=1 Tax=Pseudoalteromonas luteoviolacea CPMOR-1 TaxID=1365248 RepID=A0A167J7L9_9GAMM|nr:hypothetical protein N473_23725 [Pseudoalteromonas luteoviolacea CPMOR-1]
MVGEDKRIKSVQASGVLLNSSSLALLTITIGSYKFRNTLNLN